VEDHECMNKEDIKIAVRETLIQLGIDIHDPISLQEDMAYLRTLPYHSWLFLIKLRAVDTL